MNWAFCPEMGFSMVTDGPSNVLSRGCSSCLIRCRSWKEYWRFLPSQNARINFLTMVGLSLVSASSIQCWVKRFSHWWRAVVFLTLASKFNIEPNDEIFDFSPENDHASLNVKTASAAASLVVSGRHHGWWSRGVLCSDIARVVGHAQDVVRMRIVCGNLKDSSVFQWSHSQAAFGYSKASEGVRNMLASGVSFLCGNECVRRYEVVSRYSVTLHVQQRSHLGKESASLTLSWVNHPCLLPKHAEHEDWQLTETLDTTSCTVLPFIPSFFLHTLLIWWKTLSKEIDSWYPVGQA